MSLTLTGAIFKLGRRAALRAPERLMALAIADQCDDHGVMVYGGKTYQDLADKCGMSRRSAIRIVGGFQAGGFVEVLRRPGMPNVLKLHVELIPTAGGDKLSPPAGAEGMTNCHPRGDVICHPRGEVICHPPLTSLRKDSPPTPPRGGRASLSSQGSDAGGAEAALAAAYAEAVGSDLPGEWRRKLRRSLRNGNGPLWAGVTAADIRGAIALADRQKRPFGFGWVVNYLTTKSARAKAVSDARRKSTLAASHLDKAEAERRARAEAETARKREHLASLPADRQDHYRRQADPKGLLAQRKPQWLEAAAAELAWKDRP